jgi:hypothetical protein
MNILSMIGESVSRMVSDAAKSNDGSYIGVQTSKGHYTGGEMLSGFVVLQNNSVRQVDRVLLKVTVKEKMKKELPQAIIICLYRVVGLWKVEDRHRMRVH